MNRIACLLIALTWLLAASCSSSSGPRCGDGVIDEATEACDDGEQNGAYGACHTDCSGVARCGDGITDSPDEVCDDGEDNGGYLKCRADCGSTSGCGDGITDGPVEFCDEGEDNGLYGHCRTDCQTISGCGDGVTDAPDEGCDDGTDNGLYGSCRTDCQSVARCGDGVLDADHEICDDGQDNGVYEKCRGDCQSVSGCGDSITDAPDEGCDEGSDNGLYGHCRTSCQPAGFPYDPSPEVVDQGWLDAPPVCDEHDWLAKYLTYRLRLRGDGTTAWPGFVSRGTAAGQSIPASRREPDLDCAGHWSMQDCPRPDLPDARGRYNWGDATIWLGAYIETLATEYAVFTALGLETAQTLDDLALALGALDRVDEAAEVPFGQTPARDGFFLRDDVPIDFYLLPDGSYRFPRPADPWLGYECVSSTSACPPVSVADGSFTSQDQVIGLIQPLALVAALVPDGVEARGLALRQTAREQIHRMVKHLRDHLWRVTAPDNSHPPDAWGGNAIGFSYLLAGAANAVCGSDFGVADYQDTLSTTVGLQAFHLLETGWDATFNYNRTMALRLLAITDDWSDDEYASRAVADGKDAFALARAVLRGAGPGAALSAWRIEAILDSAPCAGPCFHTTGCADPPGWGGEHRTTNPGDRYGSRHWSGEFTGLDYLALHNLYRLVRLGRTEMAVPEPPPDCDGFRDLDAILAAPAPGGESYDPGDPCARADLRRRFCGRSFAVWLDAAYRGEVTVRTGPLVWSCSGAATCQLLPAAGSGTAGDDLILGTPQADDFSGLEGEDCLYGFDGDDSLDGGPGDDELHGGAGNDELVGDTLTGTGTNRLFGEDGDDVLAGGAGSDELLGGEGADTITGGPGDDLIQAGPGDDTVEGNIGTDTIHGDLGADTLLGGDTDDVIWGGPGRDRIDGGGGDDYLSGGPDDDLLLGQGGNDTVIGDDGIDHLCGGDADDTLWGNWAGSLCWGGAGSNTVNGCTDGSLSDADCSQTAFDNW